MTRDEIKKILMVIQTSYPNWHPQELSFTINTWFEMLREYEYLEMMTALKAYILADSSGFAPSIGQLVDKTHSIRESVNEKRLGELEAWSLVYKAICNSGYHAEEEFNKLPEEVQKAVGGPENLREWAQMKLDAVQSVEQSHFIRCYRAALQRKREDEKLPGEIKRLIANKVSSETKEMKGEQGIERRQIEKPEQERSPAATAV